jgi:hypothetical protein
LSVSAPGNSQFETVKHVLSLLNSAQKPLTFRKLRESAGLNEESLKIALEAALAQGAAFRWPDYRRLQYFWSRSAEVAAREAALETSSKIALSATALAEQARKSVPGFSKKAMEPIVASLLSERRLQKVESFTSGKLLIRPGDSAAYAASARAFVENKFRKSGLDPSALFSPSPPASANALEPLLDAVRSLQPSEGVPVTAQRLRQHLPALSKLEFDKAALELRESQQVFLALHHDPFSLTHPERDLLIDGGEGTFYVSIAIR